MKNDKYFFINIILLFLMLWLPLGQYDFLINHWMKIGTYSIPFLFVGLFAFREKELSKSSNYRFLALLMLVAYIIHQFEEHWIDIYGNIYAFYASNNAFILDRLGEPNSSIMPLTKESIFVINTSLVWLIGLLAILRSPKHLFPFFSMAGIIVINGFVHVMGSLITQAYNPGVLTSVLIFIPLYFWLLRKVQKSTENFKLLVIGGLIWAFLAHVIMVAGLLAANWFQIIPEYLYWVILVAWSILPIEIFRNNKTENVLQQGV